MKTRTKPANSPLPTYVELADLVAELTEVNVANLDHANPEYRFVSCFTYGPRVMPPHWQRAIDAREALIQNQAIPRQNRHGSSARVQLDVASAEVQWLLRHRRGQGR
jgi:hypothetical protein